jgi:energy-coupling factor transport system substrate-specific component
MAISLNSPLQSATNVKLAVREILLLGFFSAILIVVQVAKALIAPFLPNIELVSLFIIVYTLALEKKVFYIIYVFTLVEGTIFGFDIWWFSYLYIWSILAITVLIFRRMEKPFFWAIVSGVFGLLFGALTAIPTLFIGGTGMAVAYWVNGIIFDLLHCAGNVIAAALLFKPLYKLMKRLYLRENKSRLAEPN